MSLESLSTQIKEKFQYAPSIGATVKFDLGDDGVIFIDGRQTPPTLSHEDEEADCTLSCSAETFSGLLNGTQDPNVAFMMGKLKVKGNMGLALKLASLLED